MQTFSARPIDPDQLLAAHAVLLEHAKGRLFPSDAAEALGVSELDLLAARAGVDATRLELRLEPLFQTLATLGPVKAITRNAHAVLEVVGPWTGLDLGPHHGLVIGGPIDLRLFPRRFAYAFAVDATVRGRRSRSIQFYGPDGVAVHKVFLVEASDADAFARLVEAQRSSDTSRTVDVVAAPAPTVAAEPAPAVDRAALESGWRAMTDPHQYHGLLARHGLSRRQAVDLVPRDLARRVPETAVREVLEGARELDIPLMVFVGNQGCIQIHTGPLERIVASGGWLNVLDPVVDLHVREDSIDAVFAVRKPAEEGRWVSSLEIFSADGTICATLFGARKPGIDELPEWRELCRSLVPYESARKPAQAAP